MRVCSTQGYYLGDYSHQLPVDCKFLTDLLYVSNFQLKRQSHIIISFIFHEFLLFISLI